MKKTRLYALAGVAAVAAVGGTFAYYNASQSFTNPFDTTDYSTSVVEKFNPGDGHEWKPGANVSKQVFATNTGEGDVWVRVKFDETWKREDSQLTSKNWNSADDTFNPESADTAGANQADKTDGDTLNDTGSVVYKEFLNVLDDDADPNAEGNGAKWYFADGYYYYTSPLKTDESTIALLNSVELCADTDIGKYNEVNAYIAVEKDSEMPVYPENGAGGETWTTGTLDYDFGLKPGDEGYDQATVDNYKDKDIYTYKADELDPEHQGYANAKYELEITVELVQTDENGDSATAKNWTWYPGKTDSSDEPDPGTT